MDGYYLYLERVFRDLYDDVREGTAKDFSMDIADHRSRARWLSTLCSVSIILIYVPLALVAVSLVAAL